MASTIDDYRCKLVNKILFAHSPDEVRRFIAAAMKSLQQHKVNGHIVARFINKMLQNLDEFHHTDRDARQWENISLARTRFGELKSSLYATER